LGLFSFVGSLLGGSAQKKAVKKATQQQVDALNRAIDTQNAQFQQTRTDFAPYRDAGTAALGGYGDLLGTNGADHQQSAIDALKASPFYQSLFKNGMEANLQNASATGGVRGGNEVRSLADFGADTLAQTIQQQLANYGGLISTGAGATNSTANFGQQTANNVSGFQNNQGQARASGSLAIGGINNQMWNNAGSFLDQAVQAAIGGGMGAGGASFNLGSFLKGF
jgi:hypothetical protein